VTPSAAALPALTSVVAVSLVSLVGLAVVSAGRDRVRRLAEPLVAFAAGALLGDAFIHLLPEIFRGGGPPLRGSLLVLAGMLAFFVVEKLLRHSHLLWAHEEDHRASHGARPVLAAINLVGDALHNFIDGLLVGASWLAGPALGLGTTVAVVLHEIPQELGDFGVLVHSGLSVRKAILLNLASASVAIVGTAAALAAGTVARSGVIATLLPVAAGGFVYIAAADLIPELQHDRSMRGTVLHTVLLAAGILAMGSLTLVE
jgi:zinc and cadmium transporter